MNLLLNPKIIDFDLKNPELRQNAQNAPIDFQVFIKKVNFFLHFFSKIFGQFKKLLYLCIRFRSKNG